MKIFRSSNGDVINIGEWDYKRDENGNITNPLPTGAYEEDAEVVTGWADGLYVSDDSRRLGAG